MECYEKPFIVEEEIALEDIMTDSGVTLVASVNDTSAKTESIFDIFGAN